MDARRIPVSLRRDPREVAERHSQANPLTLYCELARGEEVTEALSLYAELHTSRTPASAPVATVGPVAMAPSGTGPWELDFSAAQMNQTVLPGEDREYWLVVYATGANDLLLTLATIRLTLAYDNISQVTPAPPEPALILAFRTIAVAGQSSIVADSSADTLTIAAGNGIVLTTNAGTDTLTITAAGGAGSGDVTGPNSATDNAIARYDGTTGKIIQSSSATLSDAGGVAADTLAISTTPTGAGGTGIFRYDTGEKVPEVGIDGITLKIGVQEYVRVYNATAGTLTKGQIVYISGAQGNRVAVQLADASVEATSAGTLGLVAQSITAGSEGFVQVSGPMYNLNTLGLTAGALLYLSETAGQWTETEPAAPAHGVRIGYVERVHASAGSIFIKVDNGYELGELHNVSDGITGATAFLVKNSTTNVWEAKNAADSRTAMGAGTGNGTVTTVSVATANGVSGSVANATTTPVITLTLGAITPTSVNGITFSGSATPTLAITGTTSVSGTNTGDVTLTGQSYLSLAGQQITASQINLASQVTGTLPIANGGTGATTAGAALTSLGAYPATNPSGYTSNTGTVTSVSGTAPVSVSNGTTTPAITVATFGTSNSGVVPASGGGTTNFLRADGTWAAPPGGGATNIQAITTSGDWTNPSPSTRKLVLVRLVGGGGGGGGGRCDASNTNRFGGGGGTSGGMVEFYMWSDLMPSALSVTIGAGGTGGVGSTTQGTSGTAGNNGGSTSITVDSRTYRAIGGNGGGGGSGTAGAGGTNITNAHGTYLSAAGTQAGGASSTTASASTPTAQTLLVPTSGGGGGGADSAGASRNGGGGGQSNSAIFGAINGGAAGTGAGGGTAGGAGATIALENLSIGTGGGGGYGNGTAAGTNGGAGGFPGGGGGGGGAGATGSGDGGAGGNGYALFITYP